MREDHDREQESDDRQRAVDTDDGNKCRRHHRTRGQADARERLAKREDVADGFGRRASCEQCVGGDGRDDLREPDRREQQSGDDDTRPEPDARHRDTKEQAGNHEGRREASTNQQTARGATENPAESDGGGVPRRGCLVAVQTSDSECDRQYVERANHDEGHRIDSQDDPYRGGASGGADVGPIR